MKRILVVLCFLFLSLGVFAQTRFSSANEYFDEIKKIDTQISTFELQKENEIADVTKKLNEEKIEQQQNVENLTKLTTERAAAFEERKRNEKAKIEQAYETKIKSEIAKIENKYKTLIDNETRNKQSIIDELTKTTFCIPSSDVVLSIGDFNVEANPMHFPMTITSRKTELNYQYNGQLTLENEADIETEANTIIKEKDTYYANIYYKVVQNGSEFNKKITTILIKSPNNAVIRTIYVDAFENNKGFTVDEENSVQPTNLENEQKTWESTKEEQKNVTKAEVVKPKEPEKIQVWQDNLGDEVCKGMGFSFLGLGAGFVGLDYLIFEEPDALAYVGYSFMGIGGVLAIIGLCIPDGYYETQYVSSIANDPVLKNVNFQTTGLTTSVSYKFSW